MALLRKLSRNILPLIAIGMLVFAVSSQLSKTPAPPKTPLAQPVTSQFVQQVAGTGITEPKSEVIAIGTPIAGIVTHVAVKAGDTVHKGAALFSIDTRDSIARRNQVAATVKVREVTARDMADKLRRYQSVRDKRAISNEELTARRFASEHAYAALREAKTQLAVLDTEIKRMTVRAPMDGTILRIDIRDGEFAQSGPLATPLIRMGDISTMHVRVQIDEADIVRFDINAPAYASVRGDGGTQIPLTFVRAEPFAMPKRNLSNDANERVDTRVKEIIYSLPEKTNVPIGVQMDVIIQASANEKKA